MMRRLSRVGQCLKTITTIICQHSKTKQNKTGVLLVWHNKTHMNTSICVSHSLRLKAYMSFQNLQLQLFLKTSWVWWSHYMREENTNRSWSVHGQEDQVVNSSSALCLRVPDQKTLRVFKHPADVEQNSAPVRTVLRQAFVSGSHSSQRSDRTRPAPAHKLAGNVSCVVELFLTFTGAPH